MEKAPEAFRTISEVAEELDVPQHVLRFWETRFSQINPVKRGGGRRYYRPADVELLKGIRQLLYGKGYTIKGVQRILRESGAAKVAAIGRGEASNADGPADSESKSSSRAVKPSAPPPPGTAARAPLAPRGLSVEHRDALKLALVDLAAAKRVLTAGKND